MRFFHLARRFWNQTWSGRGGRQSAISKPAGPEGRGLEPEKPASGTAPGGTSAFDPTRPTASQRPRFYVSWRQLVPLALSKRQLPGSCVVVPRSLHSGQTYQPRAVFTTPLHAGTFCAQLRCTSLQAGMCQNWTHRCTNEDKHVYPCGLIACLITLMGYRIFRNAGNLEIDKRLWMT